MKLQDIKKYLINDLKFQEWRLQEANKRDNKVLFFKTKAIIETRKEDLKQLEQIK